MILTKPKPWPEIIDAFKIWNIKKVVVIGCGSCAAKVGTGGTKGVKNIIIKLQKEKLNINILSSIVIEEPCDVRTVKRDLKLIKESVENADGFIVAACGLGAQTISEITKKPTIVTTDTIMMSQTERIGIYHGKCVACGTCHLNETGGICPITSCPKELLNGPCGGVIDGKCEVNDYNEDCGWIKIYNRLNELGRLDLFMKVRKPRNWSKLLEHKKIDLRMEMKEYYE